MCSFIFLISNEKIDKKIFFDSNIGIQSRGPDNTNSFFWNEEQFNVATVHNLLDISGCSVKQPLYLKSSKVLLFNGEIYEPSKSEIPDTKLLFQEFCKNNLASFLAKAQGEFAISAVDLKKKIINLFVDLIGTKPLSYSIESGRIGIATYDSALEKLGFKSIKKVLPNQKIKIKFDDLNKPKLDFEDLYSLNLKQNKNNFDDWNKSFLNSVSLRATFFNTKFFVPLSSGYDSGAICVALNHLKIPYTTVSIGDSENLKILKRRIQINKKASCIDHIQLPSSTWNNYVKVSKLIKQKIGCINYFHNEDGNSESEPRKLHDDPGSVGMYLICKEMKSRGFNAVLSGTGADEIYSDYGFGGKKYYPHSEFGGLFPDQLEDFFPWKKFYGDSQRSYLTKDEMIAGLFGIEGRYPFLDKDTIQEFLRLSAKLKNSCYKNCIARFLEIYHYPFEKEKKIGFVPQKTQFSIKEKIAYRIRHMFCLKQPNG